MIRYVIRTLPVLLWDKTVRQKVVGSRHSIALRRLEMSEFDYQLSQHQIPEGILSHAAAKTSKLATLPLPPSELLQRYAKTAQEVNKSILHTKVIPFALAKNFQQS